MWYNKEIEQNDKSEFERKAIMKNKIIYGLNFIWTNIIAFSFPVCFGWIFLDITAHTKGYAYDLGSEKDISILFGFIELLIWLILALPSNIYIFKMNKKKGIEFR